MEFIKKIFTKLFIWRNYTSTKKAAADKLVIEMFEKYEAYKAQQNDKENPLGFIPYQKDFFFITTNESPVIEYLN